MKIFFKSDEKQNKWSWLFLQAHDIKISIKPLIYRRRSMIKTFFCSSENYWKCDALTHKKHILMAESEVSCIKLYKNNCLHSPVWFLDWFTICCYDSEGAFLYLISYQLFMIFLICSEMCCGELQAKRFHLWFSSQPCRQ